MAAVDYQELMGIFSIPRPNGSAGERAVREAVISWLSQRRIPYRIHAFTQYPFFFESLGLWLILSRLLLLIAVWQGWGIWAGLVALAAGLGGALDAWLHLPLVTWPGRRQGQNILIEFFPPEPRREVLLSAHYDSKTELLDHRQRMFFLYAVPFGLAATFLVGLLAAWETRLSEWLYPSNLVLALLLFVLTSAYGLNLCLGRLVAPSPGAVDNGAACAILLGLADRLAHTGPPAGTCVTLALFSGEEVDRQGSRAYVRDRGWPVPACAVNLEAMGQDGPYVLWDRDGSVFGLKPTDLQLNASLREVVETVTGGVPVHGGPMTSDGASFLAAGVPTVVLGTFDRILKDTGFHRPSDDLTRVVFDRFPEGVEILSRFLGQAGGGD